MSDKITVDLGKSDATPSAMEALEKMGRWVVKLQEQDAKLQKIAQRYATPDRTLAVDTEAMHKALAEYQVEPIIPEGYFEDTRRFQQKNLEILQSINENTANLYAIVELINKNNEDQEKILEVMSQVLVIATAKSKEEAESLFKRAMQKLNDTTENVETMIKVMGWATTVYNIVAGML